MWFFFFFFHPFCSKMKKFLHFINWTFLSFKIDVNILYVVGKSVICLQFFAFVYFIFDVMYVTRSVSQSRIFLILLLFQE